LKVSLCRKENMIEKKIKDEYLVDVIQGLKTFEIRKEDDIRYEPGMKLLLRGQQHSAIVKILYVLRDCPQYGLEDGYCIFSLAVERAFSNGSQYDKYISKNGVYQN